MVEPKDGQHVTIKSISGVYNTKSELLKLNDHITLKSTSRYEARLSEATVDTAHGNIVSESPVEVNLPNGLLNAHRLEVTENGALIVFGGGVDMTLTPDQSPPALQEASSSSTRAEVPLPHPPSLSLESRPDINRRRLKKQ